MDLVELIKMLGIKKLTEHQARSICKTVDQSELTELFGGWRRPRSDVPIVRALQQEFPRFRWRIVQCHDRPGTYFALSIDSPDPREYEEMAKLGAWDEDGVYAPFSTLKAASS